MKTADLIVLADHIHTVDPMHPEAQGFVVSEGRCAFIGSREDTLEFRKPGTRVLDYAGEGATILPGLVDAHLHLVMMGLDLGDADLRNAESFDEVVREVVRFGRTSPDLWVEGNGWNHTRWPGQVFPTHHALSAAIPDRPVALYRIDGHAMLVNAHAMALAGISSETPDPVGGSIVRSDDGSPTGVLIDKAMNLILDLQPEADHERLVRATRDGLALCSRWGITSIAEPGVDARWIAAEEAVLRAGDYRLRNHLMLSSRNSEMLGEYFSAGPQVSRFGDRLAIRAVKLFADGALGSCGAALLEPYSDDPTNSGLMLAAKEHLLDVSRRALRAGFQPCVHAIGDRANKTVLDVYEEALAEMPNLAGKHRARVEHAQVIARDDIPRFGRLGVIPSMQATHQVSDMPWAVHRLGSERIGNAYPWRALLDSGVYIANGTDAPIESPSPVRTFHASIAREPRGARMTREEALKSMTIWAAYANFQEEIVGSISVGKYADFVVMDRDWMRAEREAILETRILSTYFAGEAAYEASERDEGVVA